MNKKLIAGILLTMVAAAAIVLAGIKFSQREHVQESSAPGIAPDITVVSDLTEASEEEPVWYSMQINSTEDARNVISAFAEVNGLSLSDYPENMVNLLARNPETIDYVLNYPLHEACEDSDIDLSSEVSRVRVPRLYQWDMRWGYKIYGSGPLGLTGCGPTCLSMVAIHLLGNTDMTPAWMADYAMNNGYYDYEDNSGSYWSLMTDGANGLGIDVVEITVDEDRMVRNLDVGNPIIAIVGEGQFTDGGHFIVITDYSDGYFTVNDPNSIANSEREWSFDELSEEIITLWVFRIM
ncbi:MAG: C39 family peptidase [Saccharofermentans sp.]|nr:C39 family peptidase [Saccharofermentans sp.]